MDKEATQTSVLKTRKPIGKSYLDLERRGPRIPGITRRYVQSVFHTDVTADLELTTEELVLVDASYGRVEITLMPPSDYVGKIVRVKKMDSTNNPVVILPNNGEEVEDDSELVINCQYDCPWLTNDGTDWYLI